MPSSMWVLGEVEGCRKEQGCDGNPTLGWGAASPWHLMRSTKCIKEEDKGALKSFCPWQRTKPYEGLEADLCSASVRKAESEENLSNFRLLKWNTVSDFMPLMTVLLLRELKYMKMVFKRSFLSSVSKKKLKAHEHTHVHRHTRIHGCH